MGGGEREAIRTSPPVSAFANEKHVKSTLKLSNAAKFIQKVEILSGKKSLITHALKVVLNFL